MGYYLGISTLMACYVIIAVGLSLLTGFTGVFSFGHAAFMALGAYTASIITVRLGMPFALAIVAAIIVAAIAGRLMGMAALKLIGDYFAIAMLGMGETTRLIMDNGGRITGGARGFGGIESQTTWYVAFILMGISIWVMRNIIWSRYGRSFKAIREDALAAECCGIDTFGMKKISLTISAAYGGLGGALFAHYMTFINPAMFDMARSTEIAAAVVFGGLGSLTGSVVAAIILVGLTEVLRPLYVWRMFIYGLILVGTIVLRPQGIMGGKEFSPKGIAMFVRRIATGAKRDKASGNGELKK